MDIEHHCPDPVVSMLIHRHLVKCLITMMVAMVTWLIMRVKRSHPAHHLENREHHNQVVVGKVVHLMFQLDLNMHRPRSQTTRIFLDESLPMELRRCLYMSTMSSKCSLRSRRYLRAQGGKLEIPPAQKLSILSSAHRAHGSAHTNVFALENQSERELLIMLLAGLQCSNVNLIIVLYFSVMASKTAPTKSSSRHTR